MRKKGCTSVCVWGNKGGGGAGKVTSDPAILWLSVAHCFALKQSTDCLLELSLLRTFRWKCHCPFGLQVAIVAFITTFSESLQKRPCLLW
jgi:hypothetical protein